MDKEGLIPPELFYLGLTVWVSSDPLGLAASQANFYPPPPEWLHDKYDTTGENLHSESGGTYLDTGPDPPTPHCSAHSITSPLPLCPLHSPSSSALGVCPVPLPAAWTPEDCRLCRSHRRGPCSVHRGWPGRGACLPQWLSLPLLGAVSGSPALLPAGSLHLAGMHLPRLCSALTQPVDSWPHSEYWQGGREKTQQQPTPPCPNQHCSCREPWVSPALRRCWSWR